MGNVYVFNATTNDMTLILNNHPISGTLSGAAQGSSYKPNVTTIARVPGSGNPQTANFGGQNSLIVSFPSGGSQVYSVPVNQTLQNQQGTDLQLYIFYTDAVLVSPGQQQDNPTGDSMVIEGKPLAEGEGGGGGEGGGSGGEGEDGGGGQGGGEGQGQGGGKQGGY